MPSTSVVAPVAHLPVFLPCSPWPGSLRENRDKFLSVSQAQTLMRTEFVDSVNGPWSHKDHLREGRGRPESVQGSIGPS